MDNLTTLPPCGHPDCETWADIQTSPETITPPPGLVLVPRPAPQLISSSAGLAAWLGAIA